MIWLPTHGTHKLLLQHPDPHQAQCHGKHMERAHQNEHSKRANATQVKDTLNTMPGGELK